jgi:DNA-binding CsgD family transcriptional regulator
MDTADAAFREGLAHLDALPLPFDRAQLELGYGQMLRRRGHRRAARAQLDLARDRFAALGARPYVERCDLELRAGGLAPVRRGSTEPARLTPQELVVARRIVAGMSNRDIAADMAISAKTVQFHIGNIYSKFGVRNRLQLANRLREQGQD